MKEKIIGTEGIKKFTGGDIQMSLKHLERYLTSLKANKIRIKIAQ